VAIRQGDVVSHYEMCQAERNLQQGMNFRPGGRRSVILMSLRKGAPYADRIEEGGRVLIYEGHDEPRSAAVPDPPKKLDQPEYTRHGRLNQNGQFARAARLHRDTGQEPELVHVYEKIKSNIWTFNGVFRLVDAWTEQAGQRRAGPGSQPGYSVRGKARSLEARRRAMRDLREYRQPSLRPRPPLLQGRVVARRRERPTPVRSAQPVEVRPDPVAGFHHVGRGGVRLRSAA